MEDEIGNQAAALPIPNVAPLPLPFLSGGTVVNHPETGMPLILWRFANSNATFWFVTDPKGLDDIAERMKTLARQARKAPIMPRGDIDLSSLKGE